MSSSDQLQRFIFEHSDIRGEILTLEKSFQGVLKNSNYPQAIQQLLGQFLAAAGLLSATLKFDGVITLQAQGTGPLSLIMADCTRHHNLRAIAKYSTEQLGAEYSHYSKAPLTELIGKGTLTLTIDPSKGKRYQGIVPLESPSLEKCLEAYFTQSEQLPTRIWLSTNITGESPKAAGLLLQALPSQLKTTTEENQQLWEHATQLADTITADEQLSLGHEQQLYRLFHQDELRLFEPNPVQFFCSCSAGRFATALISMGHHELNDILEEQGLISINCEFCRQQYHFDGNDIEKLFGEIPPTLH